MPEHEEAGWHEERRQKIRDEALAVATGWDYRKEIKNLFLHLFSLFYQLARRKTKRHVA